jgi:hypothetical protein
MSVIAIHQPNYLPWLGYFYKIWKADVFVFLDDVQYTLSYINRTQLRKALRSPERKWLTVPLERTGTSLIKDIRTADNKWPKDHWNRIEYLYKKAPFFDDYRAVLKPIRDNEWLSREVRLPLPYYNGHELCDLDRDLAWINANLVKLIINKVLHFKVKFKDGSILRIASKKSERIADIVERLGGEVYLSGQGAATYNKAEDFSSRGITLSYSPFTFRWHSDHEYEQKQGPWLPGLSVLDALFNIGKEGILDLFERCDK